MANYITRIELHSANEQDYQNLHREMAARGFTRTIKGNDGLTYQLPTAEYYVVTTSTLSVVYDAAVAAANATKRGAWVITSEAPASRFSLQQIG